MTQPYFEYQIKFYQQNFKERFHRSFFKEHSFFHRSARPAPPARSSLTTSGTHNTPSSNQPIIKPRRRHRTRRHANWEEKGPAVIATGARTGFRCWRRDLLLTTTTAAPKEARRKVSSKISISRRGPRRKSTTTSKITKFVLY